MTEEQARTIVPGTVVMWKDNPADRGTVSEIGRNGFFVFWHDGQRGWIDYRDAENISVVPAPAAAKP